ncbi:hypothetical protein [Brevibacterium renqingii]|uniref:hypothetical protein n=1 Tax=Brevibacterium renqingii TaxID=2776916 RepID=UPI001ADFBB72|nr:hypothetical protein [Brevibacterium renqingii]
MIKPTLDDLAAALESVGHVERISQTSFAVRTVDPVLPRSAVVESTQADLEERINDIAGQHPETIWAQSGLTAEDAAWRLLSVHVEEAIDGMTEDGQTIVIRKDDISVKG